MAEHPASQRVNMEHDLTRIVAKRMNEMYFVPAQVTADLLAYLKENGWLKDRAA